MRVKPPDGFEGLVSAAEKPVDSEFSAAGVVVDFLPATKSRGRDYILTFTLTDQAWSQGEGLKCRCFAHTEEKLPSVSSKGDVVVLHSFRLMRYNGDLIALSNFKSSWLVFHQRDIPTNEAEIKGDLPFAKSSDQVPSPSKEMVEYAVHLCNFLDRSTFGELGQITSLQASNLCGLNGAQAPLKPEKFQLIQDLVPPRNRGVLKFADLLGEVRKVWSNDWRFEMSITDYTSHESLYNYVHTTNDEQGRDGDPHGYVAGPRLWPGPWGKMSMVVTAWDAHCTFAREHVGVGSIVFLRNVQIGFDREGEKLEGMLRGDRHHPERVGIRICKPKQAQDDDRVKALLKRKRKYETDLKLHGIKGLEGSQKPMEEAAHQPAKEQEAALPGKDKKKEKKKAKKEKLRAKKKAAQTATTTTSKSNPNTLNPNIRTNKVPAHVFPLKISEILDPTTLLADHTTPQGNTLTLPFKNNLYHLKPIRVIDFHPRNIADFAAPHRTSEYEYLSDHESDATSSPPSSDIDMTDPHAAHEVTWEWRFELLVEDATPTPSASASARNQDGNGRMKLLVAGPDADFLLRDVQAADLRRDQVGLARLKEKLFLLWGDLGERREEEEEAEVEAERERGGEGRREVGQRPSARPFECLVKEYGVQVKGTGAWERVFAMFGTSIVSD